MKVGILTYHYTRNCGASLQAFALQHTLLNMGINAEIIDYRCQKLDETYKLKSFFENRSIKELAKWFLTIADAKKTQKKFQAFSEQSLKLSKPYNKDNIREANKNYDCFITGSDQVWSMYLNGDDYTYFLDFAESNKLKLSYAASMGYKEIPEQYKADTIKYINRFDAVSVREIQAAECIKHLTSIEPNVVLDPTLLLTKSDYDVFQYENIPKYKYIFVYTVAGTPNIENAAKKLSRQTGYPIIWGHMSYKKKSGVKNITTLAPNEFVSYIRNAEYVLTSSFHGMALSIILEKQFFYDLDNKSRNNNGRLESLSKLLNLNERQISHENEDLLSKLNIEYKPLKNNLNQLKKSSSLFLQNNINKQKEARKE